MILSEAIRGTLETISVWAIPAVILAITSAAMLRRVPVYEEFVEGAKEGFQTGVRIIPFLVAMLVAVGMFRASGAIDWFTNLAWVRAAFDAMGFSPELLPLALMRPLTGSGSNAIFAELVKTHGADSLIARTAGTIMGSTETTFYVIALYFGSVGVKRTRHAVAAGLLADAAGVIAAVVICRMMVA
jgi:spore maturation protein B